MHENGTGRARAALRVLAVLVPLGVAAATLGLPRTARAATSFCGSGVGVDRDQSVWQAVQAYKLATQAPSPNRNCLHCHNQSFGGIFEYSRSAFELDILGDWIKSSYWAPGYSKAWAAASRMNMKLMPPGKWPDELYLLPEPTHTALQNKIWEWMNVMAGCGPNDACIWGADATPGGGMFGDLRTCNWTL